MAASPEELPKRLPLVAQPQNRDETTNKDAKLINGWVEKEGQDYHVYKRPGYAVSTSLGAAGTGRGLFNWLDDIYGVKTTSIYKNGVLLGAVNGGSRYAFTSIMGIPNLFLKNETNAYNYDSGSGLVAVADADYPAITVPGVAYLDSTCYVMTPDAEIFGSDINDTTSWDPLNKIVAQVEPDAGVALAKQLVYVVAFKEWSTEIFYDAANATGSPLGAVQGAKVNYGCANAYSVQEINGTLLWMGSNRTAGMSVLRMDNLRAQIISTKPIERLLNDLDLTTVYSLQYNADGHDLYILTSKIGNLTLVYDLAENLWHQWTTHSGVSENYFPMMSSTFDGQNHLMQHESDGNIYRMDDSYVTDNGTQITFDLYTPNFDGGVRRNKTLWRMDIVADQSHTLLQMRVSDDDYQTWSNFRTVDLGAKRPFYDRCGTFEKRAHHFRHTQPGKLRIQAADLTLELGTN